MKMTPEVFALVLGFAAHAEPLKTIQGPAYVEFEQPNAIARLSRAPYCRSG
jgi:hypothetical protein